MDWPKMMPAWSKPDEDGLVENDAPGWFKPTRSNQFVLSRNFQEEGNTKNARQKIGS